MQRSVIAAVLAVTAAVGCANATSPPRATELTETSSARLVGGTPNSGDPAVVVFQATGANGGECTAEFVSTTVLLTAAHCVLTESNQPLTGATFRIYQGNDISKATDNDWITIDTNNVHPHPQYNGDAHDIAVLVLSKPINVKPLAFATQAQTISASDVGKSVRLIGYGANVAGNAGANDGFGLKRQLTTTIVEVQAGFVQVGKAGQTACGGDSGGPALLKINGVETIVGLDSYSDATVDCSGTEFYQRVDAETAFIAQFMTLPTGSPDSVDTPDPSSTSPHDNDGTPTNSSSSSSGSDSNSSGDEKESTKSKASTAPPPAACAMGHASSSSRSTTGASFAFAFLFGCALAIRIRRRAKK